MKKLWLIIYLTVLSILSGYLISKASWIGKIGIRYIYKEYSILRSWWKVSLSMCLILSLLYMLHSLFESRWPRYMKHLCFANITAAIMGLLITYNDFRHTLSHRWMGERFHLGAYLFWIGWLSISIFFLVNRPIATNRDKKEKELL